MTVFSFCFLFVIILLVFDFGYSFMTVPTTITTTNIDTPVTTARSRSRSSNICRQHINDRAVLHTILSSHTRSNHRHPKIHGPTYFLSNNNICNNEFTNNHVMNNNVTTSSNSIDSQTKTAVRILTESIAAKSQQQPTTPTKKATTIITTKPLQLSSLVPSIKPIMIILNSFYKWNNRMLHIGLGATAIVGATGNQMLGLSALPLYGILSLTCITSIITVLLTMYKQYYCISVGYGISIFSIGTILFHTFHTIASSSVPGSSTLLIHRIAKVANAYTFLLMIQGLRLATFLFLREKTNVWQQSTTPYKEQSYIKRLPLAISVAVFYSFLTIPIFYTLRTLLSILLLNNMQPQSQPLLSLLLSTTKIGIFIGYLGCILQTISDYHKFYVKVFANNKTTTSNNDFHDKVSLDTNSKKNKQSLLIFNGPTTLCYRLCRHPNYLGEILFWLGIYIGGVPSFIYNSIVTRNLLVTTTTTSSRLPSLFPKVATFFHHVLLPFILSSVGLYCIIQIMINASCRLEKRQHDKYAGQTKYDDYIQQVKTPLLFFKI